MSAAFVVVIAQLLLPAASHALAPVASFTVSPASPVTLDTVTFISTSTGDITSESWDLDNDGDFDDSAGLTAVRSFPRAGSYTVRLRATGPDGSGEQAQNISVANRIPTSSIVFFPRAPVAGQVVTFVSTSQDLDGSIASQSWDLDNDGSFDDATGDLASRSFPGAGSYTVRLSAIDSDGGQAVSIQTVDVEARALAFLSPSPVVRLVGRATRRGVRVSRLIVDAPPGSRVEVRCAGRRCPRSQARTTAVHASTVLRFRRFERRFRSRTLLRVLITKPEAIGKYTRFLIRRGRQPSRRDLCILPGATEPSPCPAESGAEG